MAVSTAVTLTTAGLYVPFRGVSRLGAVGTLHVRLNTVGAAGGGNVTLLLSMRGDEFGFNMLWVPTLIVVEDGLSSAITVSLTYIQLAERLGGQGSGMARVITTAPVSTVNIGELAGSSPHISVNPVTATEVNVLQALWSTNTDTIAYVMNIYGTVYDEQAMARESELELAGPVAGPL